MIFTSPTGPKKIIKINPPAITESGSFLQTNFIIANTADIIPTVNHNKTADWSTNANVSMSFEV